MPVSASPSRTATPVVESPSLSPDQVKVLFARSRKGDRDARETLIRFFMPLAKKLAIRYRNRLEEQDDLQQVANLGLVKAIDRFDPSRGLAFSIFAIPTISGEIKRHFRDRTWAVRVPRSLQERCLAVERAVSKLTSELDRSPTVGEIGAEIQASDEEVLEGLEAERALGSASLDATSGDGEETAPLIERLGEVDPRIAVAEEFAGLAPAINGLPERERKILFLRFVEDKTQSEIGDQLGISQMHVSRLLRRSVSRLRDAALTAEPA